MGIASSSSSSSTESKPAKEAAPIKLYSRKLYALFTQQRRESTTEEERERASEALYYELMKGGGACGELSTALQDCMEEESGERKCMRFAWKLNNCMYTHHSYYQPILEVLKSAEEGFFKELEAVIATKSKET